MIALLDQKIQGLLQIRYSTLDPAGSPQYLLQVLKEVEAVVERMAEICLFLDVNYCQK